MTHGVQGSGHFTLILAAYKILTQKPAAFYIQHAGEHFSVQKVTEAPSTEPGLDVYDVLYNMVTHMDPRDFIEHAVTAVIMLWWLELTGYLAQLPQGSDDVVKETFSDERSQLKVFFLHLLFHFYSVVQSNNHSIQDLKYIGETVKRGIVGNALFPTVASIMNHSCDPNSTPVVINQTQVTVATRAIREGEEINHIYQGHYGDTPLAKRRETLQRMFHFECHCLACQRDYPLGQDLPRTFSDPKSILRSKGKSPKKLDKIYLEFNSKIESATAKGDMELVLKLYCQRTQLVSEYLEPPHFMYLTSRAALTDCLCVLYGNRDVNAKDQILTGIYM